MDQGKVKVLFLELFLQSAIYDSLNLQEAYWTLFFQREMLNTVPVKEYLPLRLNANSSTRNGHIDMRHNVDK